VVIFATNHVCRKQQFRMKPRILLANPRIRDLPIPTARGSKSTARRFEMQGQTITSQVASDVAQDAIRGEAVDTAQKAAIQAQVIEALEKITAQNPQMSAQQALERLQAEFATSVGQYTGQQTEQSGR
jgi:hypothetical protein